MEICNLSKTYTTKESSKKALNSISLSLSDTGLVFILGKSGSGKSTLLNILGGIDKPTEGDVYFKDFCLSKAKNDALESYRANYCSFIFQEYNLIEELNVENNLKLSLSKQDEKNDLIIKRHLEIVGLAGYEKKKPYQCSGGECQRIAIARAIIKSPAILLCDEPTGALDKDNSIEVMRILKRLSQDKLIIVVSHDTDLAASYADRIIKLSEGMVIEDEGVQPENEASKTLLEKNNSFISLPMAFKLGITALKKHPIRFILSLILCMLVFSISVVSMGISNYSKEQLIVDNFIDSEFDVLTINRKHKDVNMPLSAQSINEFNKSNSLESFGVINENIVIDNLNENKTDDLVYSLLPIGLVDSTFLSLNGYEVEGRYPLNKNEIIVSDVLNEIIIQNGLLHKKVQNSLNESLHFNNTEYEVTGIATTGFDIEKYRNIHVNSTMEDLEKLNEGYLNSSAAFMYVNDTSDFATDFIDGKKHSIMLQLQSGIFDIARIEGLTTKSNVVTLASQKSGVYISFISYIELLREIGYNASYNGQYYNTSFDLLMSMYSQYLNLNINELYSQAKNNGYTQSLDDFLEYMNISYYNDYGMNKVDILKEMLQTRPEFEHISSNIKITSMINEMTHAVIGFHDGNDEMIILSEDLYSEYYKLYGGIYSSCIIYKNDLTKEEVQRIYNIDYMDRSYQLKVVFDKKINRLDSFMNLMGPILIAASCILLIVGIIMLILFMLHLVADKNRTIAILKLLGFKNIHVFGILMSIVAPILLVSFMLIIGLRQIGIILFKNYILIRYLLIFPIGNLSLYASFVLIILAIGFSLTLAFVKIHRAKPLELLNCE